ncbi:putative LRR receptor-like serine/threonine-protein kinase, partial [Nymphaea thermarum]
TVLRQTHRLKETGDLLKLVDPELGANFSKEEAQVILNVALLCTNASPSLRPDMSKVVDMIEGKILIDPQSVCSIEKVDSTVIHFSQPQHSRTLDNSQEGPWTRTTASSVSMASKESTKDGQTVTEISEDMYPKDAELDDPGNHPNYVINQTRKKSSPWRPCCSGGKAQQSP